jgi:hypothetical protein
LVYYLFMPFIRSKTIKGRVYFYLVESYWADGGKPRQRVLLYLGRFETVQAAYHYWQGQVTAAKDAAGRRHARMMVGKLEAYL